MSLRIRDGHPGDFGGCQMKCDQIRQIEAPMQGGNGLLPDRTDQREIQNVTVKMQHIKFIGPTADLLELYDVVRQWIHHGWVDAQSSIAARY